MVFDGKHLSSFDEGLLDELKQTQTTMAGPAELLSPGAADGPRRLRDRRTGAVVMMAFVAVVALVAGLALTARQPGGHQDKVDPAPHISNGAAKLHVLAALDQTAAAQSFDFTYSLSEAGTPTTTIQLPQCMHSTAADPPPAAKFVPVPCSVIEQGLQRLGNQNITTTGKGTVNVDPKAMVASASLTGGLDVSVRIVGDQVWEDGGAGYGVTPVGPAAVPSQLLSGFAPLVEGSLGRRAGALAMTQMASPNAYLALESQAVTGATAAGTGTVDGVTVTNYDVTEDLSQLPNVPGLSADETKSMQEALGVLTAEHYHSTTARVAVDANGYIRQISSVAHFADAGTVTFAATYSNFGCAGTVQAPGPTAPPATTGACPAPASPNAAAPSTTAIAPTTTTGTSVSPSSTDPGATDPGATVPSTTRPPAGDATTTTASN